MNPCFCTCNGQSQVISGWTQTKILLAKSSPCFAITSSFHWKMRLQVKFMWKMFLSFRKHCRGIVNMSYQIRVFCQRLMRLETFLFQKKAWGRHNDCLVCENLSSSIHGRFVTFWKLIYSHAVTPRWLDDGREFIQSGWSKQRDSCSLAHEIQDRGCWSLWKPYFSKIIWWLALGFSMDLLLNASRRNINLSV